MQALRAGIIVSLLRLLKLDIWQMINIEAEFILILLITLWVITRMVSREMVAVYLISLCLSVVVFSLFVCVFQKNKI